MTNHLANETSPYLLQHAENPVAWFPWGEEALDKARREDKPVFLSIGYAACHWCHVMAHESFEDERIAELLNESFISIKVDREERPDLDRLYMAAVQSLTGSGGWPLSAFLTPDGRPFYGGTYFPPSSRYGLPSFSTVLLAVKEAWTARRPQLLASAEELHRVLERAVAGHLPATEAALDPATLDAAVSRLEADFDSARGGWGTSPKFPQPMAIEFLLRQALHRRHPGAMGMAQATLESMARGGIYDQLGGGFHRYSVDGSWLVPHFEKMLYDNAQLSRVYIHAWQMTGLPIFRAVAEETLDYVLREMTDSRGGFHATQDADSEGHEGRFFVWAVEEIEKTLGERAPHFMQAYGVTAQGNFEGANILHLQGPLEQRPKWAGERAELFQRRRARTAPARDGKVLASWNGLMLAALAEAAVALGREDYLQAAERNADFLLTRMRRQDGRLWHVWNAGQSRVNGYLEDYTYVIEGLLALHQSTSAPRWASAARDLAEQVLKHFSADVGFYDTSDDHEVLIARPRALEDNAVPSGNAVAALAFLRLADVMDEPRYRDWAERALVAIQPLLAQHPLAFSQWLVALDYALAERHLVSAIPGSSVSDTRMDEANPGRYDPYRLAQVVPVEVGGVVRQAGQGVPDSGQGIPKVGERRRS